MVLAAIYMNVPVPFKIDSIFRRHDEKHLRGKELHGFVKFMASLIKLAKIQKEGLSLDGLFEGAFNLLVGLHDNEWWQNANAHKNKGLYVSYIASGQKFLSPSEVSKEDFEKSKRIGEDFVEMANVLQLLKEDDYKKLLK